MGKNRLTKNQRLRKTPRANELIDHVFATDAYLDLIFSALVLEHASDKEHTRNLSLTCKRMYAFGMRYYARGVDWKQRRTWQDLRQEEERIEASRKLFRRSPHLRAQVKMVSLSTDASHLINEVVQTFAQMTTFELGAWAPVNLADVEPLRHLRDVHIIRWEWGRDSLGPNREWCRVLFSHSNVTRLGLCCFNELDFEACLVATHGTLRRLDLNACHTEQLSSSRWSEFFALTPDLQVLNDDRPTLSMLKAQLPQGLRLLKLGGMCMCQVVATIDIVADRRGLKLSLDRSLRLQIEACVGEHSFAPHSPAYVSDQLERALSNLRQLSVVSADASVQAPSSDRIRRTGDLVTFAALYECQYRLLDTKSDHDATTSVDAVWKMPKSQKGSRFYRKSS